MTDQLIAAGASQTTESPTAPTPDREVAAYRYPGVPPFADTDTDRRAQERLLGKRILIVEDEALLAFELQLAFEDDGAEVLGPALTLMKALEVVTHAREIDFAVLDVDIAADSTGECAGLFFIG